jgi:hypothetical protein
MSEHDFLLRLHFEVIRGAGEDFIMLVYLTTSSMIYRNGLSILSALGVPGRLRSCREAFGNAWLPVPYRKSAESVPLEQNMQLFFFFRDDQNCQKLGVEGKFGKLQELYRSWVQEAERVTKYPSSILELLRKHKKILLVRNFTQL